MNSPESGDPCRHPMVAEVFGRLENGRYALHARVTN